MAVHDDTAPAPRDPIRLAVDLAGLANVDIVDIGALVRLQLLARRFGATIELHNAHADFADLLVFAGLVEVLPVADLDRRRGQTEVREEGGVHEEVDPVDPAV
jgi:STAS domain